MVFWFPGASICESSKKIHDVAIELRLDSEIYPVAPQDKLAPGGERLRKLRKNSSQSP